MQGAVGRLALGIRSLLAGLMIGTMVVVFSVSKATLIFSGALTPFLGLGIGMVLFGALLMSVVAVISANCRAVVVQPQDVTAVLLATAAGALIAGEGLTPDRSFATVVAMVALSTVLAGAAAYAVGYLKLAFFIRYLPRQVTAGFLAASGLLLVREAFSIVVADAAPATPATIASLWPQWLPWLGLGLALAIAVRRSRGGFLVPLSFALAAAAFYVVLAALGVDLDAARGLGWLLGPFPDGSLLQGAEVLSFGDVQWRALVSTLPMIAAVVGLCLLGALLNVVSVELLNGRETDLDGTLRTLGVANAAAGLVGGLPGYHGVAMTGLARRVGIADVVAGLSVAGLCALTLLFGAAFLSDLPRGLVAGVLWYLGFDLLLTAFWDYGRRIPRRDQALVLAVPLVAVTVGVLPALALGLVTACLLFVIVYARIDVVRLFTTAAHLKARVERSPRERAVLSGQGDRIHIYALTGFLFFGTTRRLLERLKESLESGTPPRVVILDVRRIVGLDLSAWEAFETLVQRCAEQSVELILTGLSAPLQRQFERQLADLRAAGLRVVADLDLALAEFEDRHLAQAASATVTPHDTEGDVLDILRRHGERRDFPAGRVVMREGEPSDSIMVLLDGQLAVSVAKVTGGDATLNRLLPGTLLGEVGFYSGRERSASVTATRDSTVLVLGTEALARLEREAPEQAATLHRALARIVSQRLIAATLLLKDADL